MNGRHYIALRALVFLATLTMLAGHRYLPLKQLDLLPETAELAVYGDDTQEGGNSYALWDDESIRQYTCHIRAGEVFRFCGLAIKPRTNELEYTAFGLSGYNNLLIHLDYDGPAERVNLFYRNTDTSQDAYTPSEQGFQSKQYIFTYLDKPELNKPIIVELSNFNLADWWLQENYTHRGQIRRGLENIVEFGINTDNNPPIGDYSFTLHSLVAQGEWITKEQLYFYIVIMWLTAALFEATFRIIKLAREKHRYANSFEVLSKEFKQLEDTAVRDPLTQTYNRAGLLKVIGSLQASTDFNNFYLYIFDLDNFKSINDTHGHDAGDAILKQFAARISNNIRGNDQFARWGGEEFVLISQNKTPESAYYFANKLKMLISEIEFALPEAKTLKVTASIGISPLNPTIKFEQAFKNADQCLYQAKNNGRNQAIMHKV